MVDLLAIQKEQAAWSVRNFGHQHQRYPLLGLIEECLEFDEAWKQKEDVSLKQMSMMSGSLPATVVDSSLDALFSSSLGHLYADIDDAVGDIGIYMLDYCGKTGLQLHYLWQSRRFLDGRTAARWFDLAPLARKLAHHQLKGEQGIRGTPEEHAREIERTCQALLAHLERICESRGKNFPDILEAVWAKISKRDWKKNPTNAHEVAGT